MIVVDSRSGGLPGDRGGTRRGRPVLKLERKGIHRFTCAGCGGRTGHVRDAKVRTWDDLPWAEHSVRLRCRLRQLWCRRCEIRTERVAFADPHARLTRRFRQRNGLDCQLMPTSHAAVRHAVSWGAAAMGRTRVSRGGGSHAPATSAATPGGPTKFSAARDSGSGPCCPTWCAAR